MYPWLSETVGNKATVVTASRRLARLLNSEYSEEQLARSHQAWLSPDIRVLDDWLVSTINSATDTLPLVLSAHASSVVWEHCLRGEAGNQLVDFAGLLRQARQSWQSLHDWRVPLSEVSAAARSHDEQLFAAVARKYQSTLAEKHWIDGAQATGMLTGLVESRAVAIPERVVYAGFDRLVPALEALFAAVTATGCTVQAAPVGESADDLLVAAFDNEQAELRAAGAWARRQIGKNPAATIAVVCASLERNAVTAERLIREGVAPGWQYGTEELRSAVNTSYGRRLADYPAISIALLLLRWVRRDLWFGEVSQLLRTPFMVGDAAAGRCKLELYLRRWPNQPWSPAAIAGLFPRQRQEADAVEWLIGIEQLSAFQAAAEGRASPAEWADRIDRLLQDLAWPGTKSLGSEEFQLQNRWRDLLNEFSRLHIVAPKMTFAEASDRLDAMAKDTIYQAETRRGAVQLLGPLEAAGMRFDSIWVAGLDADVWPSAPHPLTLVSRELQRRYAMPDATPDDTLAFSRRVLNRLAGSAGTVRLSWPRTRDDTENSASPLIAGYGAMDPDRAVDPGWHAASLIATAGLEQVADDPVPAVQQGELLAGGAYTVQLQVTDPFAAFARGRLRVAELEPVKNGLSPALRGRLIHKALQVLFADMPSQDDIRQWQRAGLGQRISAAADAAVKQYLWHADPVIRKLLALEHVRLCSLLEKFITEEQKRPAFKIVGVEQEIEFEQSGVHLDLRVDRIDRLPDDSLLIADYKTGLPKKLLDRYGEPHDLQLVVYACALDDAIGGLVLINIDSRSIEYRGIGASTAWDGKRAAEWSERLASWKERVSQAIRQIAAGDARINLNLPAGQSRPLNILSRFEELRRGQR